VLKVEGPDSLSRERLEVEALPAGWATDVIITQPIGDRWLLEQRSLLLEVPSVLVPETWNILLNPLHPEVRSLKIVATYEHPWDARLF